MLRHLIFLIIVALSYCSKTFVMSEARTQTKYEEVTSPFTFLPGSTLFPPLAADYLEPRVGLRKEIGSSRMKLDVGSMLDLLEYTIPGDNSKKLRLGIEFFTYALTTSVRGLRLQVDAVDGIFGGHVLYDAAGERSAFSVRLRILHLSAHFVDGHFDSASDQWNDGRNPVPFTKDFGELLGAYEFRLSGTNIWLLAYSGFSYATLIRPTDIRRFAIVHGIQIRTADEFSHIFDKPFILYAADHLTLVGIPEYIGTNNLEFGMKFGRWSESGIRIYLSYFKGLDIFSQYYDVRRNEWGVGFAFDFW
ncbi:MAG: hypothetical protein O7D34_09025 [Ignavibacteria bacterium]|nr:hypothetical protein [Ignavibacteria bacterium]